MNLAQILRDAAPHFETRPLLRFEARSYAYAEIVDQVDRLTSALLESGIGPGQRVLLLAWNKPEWLVSLFAVLRAGAVVVPLNPALTLHEIAYVVEHSEPSLAIVDNDLVDVVAGAGLAQIIRLDRDQSEWHELVRNVAPSQFEADCKPEDPAAMFYTSGTTGRPKGALLSHAAEMFTANVAAKHLRIAPDEVSLIPGSLSFIYPLVIDCLGSIRGGASIVLQDRFHPELCLRAVESERVTIFMGVPTMFAMMLNWAEQQEVDASSLRLCISAGQNLAWNVAERFEKRFGVPVYDLWGQTEGTPITTYDPFEEARGRPESCGRPLPGCDIEIIDDKGNALPAGKIGEVLLTGPNVMLEYFKNPRATAETLKDGWIYTGDLGRRDQDGYLYIVGRKRDLIIRGGANIYPSEVEEAVYSHPAVAECAVVGRPDETFGELVTAFVALKEGRRLEVDELIRHCGDRLAEYKVPSRIDFLDELPKGPTGKILKRTLRERLTATAA